MRRVGSRQSAVRFGFALPSAYAPVLSVFGDYYEMGSILVTRLAAIVSGGPLRTDVRGDDLAKVLEPLTARGLTVIDASLVVASALVGVALILLTLRLGAYVSGPRAGAA